MWALHTELIPLYIGLWGEHHTDRALGALYTELMLLYIGLWGALHTELLLSDLLGPF